MTDTSSDSNKRVYLDYAAATPLDDSVRAAMEPYGSLEFYNASATYEPARQVKAAILDAQSRVAACLGARGGEIVFTSGGTEANNLAIHGVAEQFPGSKVLVSAIEHDSVLKPAKQHNYQVIPVNKEGIVEPEAVSDLIDDETVLVSIMQASNEIGTVQPLRKIALELGVIRKDRQKRGIKLPLYLHTDACQAANYLDVHVHRLGVDMMTINSGKLYGSKGSGALFVRAGVVLAPQIDGGGQQRSLRSGTENTSGIIGLAAALEIAQRMRLDEAKRLGALQDQLINALESSFEAVTINGSRKHRLPNNVHITFAGQDNERLLMALDQAGIYAAAGSACSASSDLPSHVLAAIGLDDVSARSSVRFTMGRQTTTEDISYLVKVLSRLLATSQA